MRNVEKTIISQYANSPILCQLIANLNDHIDPAADLDAFYRYVWDVSQAQGFGLDIWGKIVNVGRSLTIPGASNNFGFKDSASDMLPFGQAPFYVTAPATNTYALTDNAYRTLILVKALANITDGSAPSINRLLQNLFSGRGRCYVLDLGGMQMRYVFEFDLQPFERAILTQSGTVPRPTGVVVQKLETNVAATFGFKEALQSQPFGQGAYFNQNTGLTNAIL